MKGKIAFVLGAAVGYVLGSRAGRERYEQIKRGAQQVWQTEPVQRGVSAVKEAVDERADVFKVFIARAGADLLSGFAQPKTRTSGAEGEARAGEESSADDDASKPTAPKSTGSKSSASKSTASKSSTAKSKTAKRPAQKRSSEAGS
ncbi:YtxH domain-containing protein [Leucobacter soli]|uniref:YtxH domain-containing protein n=1 Tax=Leucobacter soli TaxID=2812850 RepID=A0A916JV43_9MICO|nr:YtxH domain-containing protein [Leucobacter soli]CAG7606434.1 hypothetical protein LEUCIP111803_00929 [Leucobacter soli]